MVSTLLSHIDLSAVKHAAGFVGIAFAHMQHVYDRIPKRDRVSQEMLTSAMQLNEDAQLLLVVVMPYMSEQLAAQERKPAVIAGKSDQPRTRRAS